MTILEDQSFKLRYIGVLIERVYEYDDISQVNYAV